MVLQSIVVGEPKEILAENGKVTGIVFKKCLSVINDGKFALFMMKMKL